MRLLEKKGADLSRPYEKCLMYGASALTDAELIAVIIRSGTPGLDASGTAERILRLAGNGKGLTGLCRLSVSDYTSIPGIGEVKAIMLLCVGEISKRIATQTVRSGMRCTDPCDVAAYYMEQLRHDDQENIVCMMLDTKLRMIGEERISRGTATTTVVSPREVFMAALRHRAVAILLVHNHPSGDPAPSEADVEVTIQMKEAGELLGIRLVDHIVIGDRRYVSFRESGVLGRDEEEQIET